MKIKTFALSFSLVAFGFVSLAFSQGYDKAAQEKAARDKEEIVKRGQAQQQYNQPTQAPQYNKQEPSPPVYQNTPGSKSAQFIPCPVTQIEAKITSSVPSDWWDTPQVGNLQNTQVTNIGGIPTLQCLYWAYGTNIPLMKRVPAGLQCSAQSNGFQCQ
ncbi:MAG: hypothetical protein HQM15_04330 [Deltaproteobacteria bacterium]|nr:hypothetical protein [Deltaproteobacteria bacterium]